MYLKLVAFDQQNPTCSPINTPLTHTHTLISKGNCTKCTSAFICAQKYAPVNSGNTPRCPHVHIHTHTHTQFMGASRFSHVRSGARRAITKTALADFMMPNRALGPRYRVRCCFATTCMRRARDALYALTASVNLATRRHRVAIARSVAAHCT